MPAGDGRIETVLLVAPLGVGRIGPWVTISGQVMSGAGSPGQQVWTGNLPRSSSPLSTISWQGADVTVLGFIAVTVQAGQHVGASRQPPGGSGWRRGRGLADAAQFMGFAVHAPRRPARCAEEIDQHRHVGRVPSTHHVLEQHRRAPLGQQAGLDLSHLGCGDTGAVTRTRGFVQRAVNQAGRMASWVVL